MTDKAGLKAHGVMLPSAMEGAEDWDAPGGFPESLQASHVAGTGGVGGQESGNSWESVINTFRYSLR